MWPFRKKSPANESRAADAALTQRQTLWIVVSVLSVFLPLTVYLPNWLVGVSALALFWRGWLLWQRMPMPPGWLVNTTALLGVVGVGLHFHSLFGRDSGVALLSLLVALKLFEMRKLRDGFFVVLLAYFLVLSQFFYTQSIATALAMVASVILVTAAMSNLNHEHRTPVAALRLSSVMLLQALPFMVILFVLFPRVSGPLWGMSADTSTASTGLSDTMSPGSISQLSLSDAIAFRVRFEQTPPEKPELYWRGPVLTKFDGRTWTMTRPRIFNRIRPRPAGERVAYEVTLEPHARHWLFALEFPTRLAPSSMIGDDWQMFSTRPIRTRFRYAMTSDLALPIGLDEEPEGLRQATELPRGFNPRARVLASELRAKYPRDGELVQRMLAIYRKEEFVYTLSPPPLGRDSVDDFLFNTRRGFCEHYASSFVFVIRAAGIPARVVTGYQGGEINPVDGYLEVRQLDAHAWAEVWLKDQGWVRIDPTAAIAPNRVENNMASALPASDPIPLMIRPGMSWLRDMRYRWEAVANAWNQWVLGYDTENQRKFLQRLGMNAPDWQTMTGALATLCGAVMLLLTAWTLRQWRRADPVLRAWQRLSHKLRRHGLERHPWEGPRDYAQRVAAAQPQLAGPVGELCALFETLRYGSRPADAAEFRRRVASFKP